MKIEHFSYLGIESLAILQLFKISDRILNFNKTFDVDRKYPRQWLSTTLTTRKRATLTTLPDFYHYSCLVQNSDDFVERYYAESI